MDKGRSNKNISSRTAEVKGISCWESAKFSHGIKILIAGAGGQGILLMGKILAQALLSEGKQVTWLPSYGAEVRGGTCKCMVVTSNDEITSPYIFHPDYLIVMNEPSYLKYSTLVDAQGLIFYNHTLLSKEVLNPQLSNIKVKATEFALKIGEVKSANMVMLGAFIKHSGIVKFQTVIETLPQFVKREEILQLDKKAFKQGFNFINDKS